MIKIMIVDDDQTSLAIGKAFLEDEYEVVTAFSGRQALGAMQSGTLPDLILLDMLMPGMNGIDILQCLRQEERLQAIPVIFLTGERSVDIELEGYSHGAADFLLKPVNRALLKIKIERQLRYVRLERENQALKSGEAK